MLGHDRQLRPYYGVNDEVSLRKIVGQSFVIVSLLYPRTPLQRYT